MPRAFGNIAFTPAVRAFQTRMGSRSDYAAWDGAAERGDTLGQSEATFIAARDGFYQASVGEGGWPYVQFRGGPAGFLRVLDARTIAYADFRGNRQYVSAGNIGTDARVALILMDYPNRRRLKILGRARLVGAADEPALVARLADPSYSATVERAVLIRVEAFDWNCPQHITPRFTEAEIAQRFGPSWVEGAAPQDTADEPIGSGALSLVVSGIRQLTPRVRAFELRAADGGDLPAVTAGAHIDLPLRRRNGRTETRRYSISSNPARRDAYEVAVLREAAGSGGSAAIHDSYRLGLQLACDAPGNDFPLHDDPRPAVLVAGGIGITPIKAMAQQLKGAGRGFEVHYAGRALREMAYRDRLQREFGPAITLYAADAGRRLDVRTVIDAAPREAVFYVCGPARLIDGVRQAAAAAGIDAARVRFERFQAVPRIDDRPLTVELRRSGRSIEVGARVSLLDAIRAAGVDAPAACRAGTCGTCAVKVLDGIADHRDSVLSAVERDVGRLFCPCVSRAATDVLALDI